MGLFSGTFWKVFATHCSRIHAKSTSRDWRASRTDRVVYVEDLMTRVMRICTNKRSTDVGYVETQFMAGIASILQEYDEALSVICLVCDQSKWVHSDKAKTQAIRREPRKKRMVAVLQGQDGSTEIISKSSAMEQLSAIEQALHTDGQSTHSIIAAAAAPPAPNDEREAEDLRMAAQREACLERANLAGAEGRDPQIWICEQGLVWDTASSIVLGTCAILITKRHLRILFFKHLFLALRNDKHLLRELDRRNIQCVFAYDSELGPWIKRPGQEWIQSVDALVRAGEADVCCFAWAARLLLQQHQQQQQRDQQTQSHLQEEQTQQQQQQQHDRKNITLVLETVDTDFVVLSMLFHALYLARTNICIMVRFTKACWFDPEVCIREVTQQHSLAHFFRACVLGGTDFLIRNDFMKWVKYATIFACTMPTKSAAAAAAAASASSLRLADWQFKTFEDFATHIIQIYSIELKASCASSGSLQSVQQCHAILAARPRRNPSGVVLCAIPSLQELHEMYRLYNENCRYWFTFQDMHSEMRACMLACNEPDRISLPVLAANRGLRREAPTVSRQTDSWMFQQGWSSDMKLTEMQQDILVSEGRKFAHRQQKPHATAPRGRRRTASTATAAAAAAVTTSKYFAPAGKRRRGAAAAAVSTVAAVAARRDLDVEWDLFWNTAPISGQPAETMHNHHSATELPESDEHLFSKETGLLLAGDAGEVVTFDF
jgi:hypothetical protein